MIGFEPGAEVRVSPDTVRFTIPEYLLQAALDASYAAKDHTHTVSQITDLPGTLGAYLTKTDAANTYETRTAGWTYNDALDSDDTRFPWIDLAGGKFRTSWYNIRNKLKAYFDGLYLSLKGGSVDGTVSASLTHRDNGGYFNIGSYGTSAYGSGYARAWWNENDRRLTLSAASGGDTIFSTHYVEASRQPNAANHLTRKDYVDSRASAAENSAVSRASNGRAYPRRVGGSDLNFHWSGQSGQPTWVWGASDSLNTYVYNPSNFNVASVGGWTAQAIIDRIESRARAWAEQEGRNRTRDYMLAEHVPVGGFALLRRVLSGAVGAGYTEAGSNLEWSNVAGDSTGRVNYGTWVLCGITASSTVAAARTSVWKRIG